MFIHIFNSYIYIDINECDDKNGGCQHGCNNEIGSYHCTCNSGYVLDSDMQRCYGKYINVSESTDISFRGSILQLVECLKMQLG